MNVQLLPAALEEIEVLRATGYRGAGFLLGTAIGRFILVERLLPLDFALSGNDAVYAGVVKKYGERLQGIFFCRKPPVAMDWSIGDLVLAVRLRDIRAFTCEFAATDRAGHQAVAPLGGKKARLVPLLEDAEEKWPI